MSRGRGASHLWRALLVFGALAATGAAMLSLRRYGRFEVIGESMSPALRPGDYVVVDRRAFARRPARRGEVVLARDPRAPDRMLVKRVADIDDAGRPWLLGDNALASTDSRAFGWVEPGAIAGRVVGRYWPFLRAGRVPPRA